MSEGIRAPGERVVIDRPETMNLLGLLMKGLLAANLADERKYSRAKKLEGDVAVKAGEMVITLRFHDGLLTILRGPMEKPRARVRGTMAALLAVVINKGLVGRVLSGQMMIGGNPFFLLKILPLIREPAK